MLGMACCACIKTIWLDSALNHILPRWPCAVSLPCAVNPAPRSTAGCTSKRTDTECCGRHRWPMSLTQGRCIAWQPKACFFIKSSGSVSRRCHWIKHQLFTQPNAKTIWVSATDVHFLSHPLKLQNFPSRKKGFQRSPSAFWQSLSQRKGPSVLKTGISQELVWKTGSNKR